MWLFLDAPLMCYGVPLADGLRRTCYGLSHGDLAAQRRPGGDPLQRVAHVTQRLALTTSLCKMGCGALDGDCIEHYLFCSLIAPVAKFHLRLDVRTAQGRGLRGILGHVGLPGERGFRLALHLDATLMFHNRLRHEHAGGPLGLYAARLKEASRRHSAVAAVVRRYAGARRSPGLLCSAYTPQTGIGGRFARPSRQQQRPLMGSLVLYWGARLASCGRSVTCWLKNKKCSMSEEARAGNSSRIRPHRIRIRCHRR